MNQTKADGLSSEKLGIYADSIYVISAFDEINYFTTYHSSGDVIWEVPFNSKIITWKIKEDLLFIFSQARDGLAYYLTCLHANEGSLMWEKAIVAPN
jgi:hypothetical protein